MSKVDFLINKIQYVKLEDVVVDVRNGVTYPQNKERKGLRVTRIESIQNFKIDENRLGYIEDLGLVKTENLYQVGDIVFSHINSYEHVGKTAIIEEENLPLIHGMNTLRIRFDQTKILSRFFLYYSRTDIYRKNIEQKINKSVNQVSINKTNLFDIKAPLLPINLQQEIVSALAEADTLIQKRKEAIAKLDELVQSVFFDMFGEPSANLKGWKVKILEDIALVKSGLQVTSKRSIFPIEVPYLRVANVFRNKLDLSEIKLIKVTESEQEKYKLNVGDILIVEGHGNIEEIGRSAVWDGFIECCVHQNHLIRVIPNTNLVNSYFLSYLLNLCRKQFLSVGKTTSGLNTISTSNVKQLKVNLPPIDFQNRFSVLRLEIERQRDVMHKSLLKLEGNFQSLLHQAFTGQLQFREVKVNDYAIQR